VPSHPPAPRPARPGRRGPHRLRPADVPLPARIPHGPARRPGRGCRGARPRPAADRSAPPHPHSRPRGDVRGGGPRRRHGGGQPALRLRSRGPWRPAPAPADDRRPGEAGALHHTRGRVGVAGLPGRRQDADLRRQPDRGRADERGGPDSAQAGAHRGARHHRRARRGRRAGPRGRAGRPAAAGGHRAHRGRHRRRRPEPAGRAGRAPDRGRSPRVVPERHAQPDPDGVRSPAGLRGPAAAIRGRRLARAPHPPHVDPGVRRDVPPRRRRPPGRPGHGHAPHRGGIGPDGRPGRRPPAPRPSRPGPAARPPARRPGPGRRRCRPRRPGGGARQGDRPRRPGHGSGAGRRAAAPPGGRQPAGQRPPAHPTDGGRPRRCPPRERVGGPGGGRRRARTFLRGRGQGLRALLPLGSLPGPEPGGHRPGPVDRGRGGRGPRRPGARGVGARPRRPVLGGASVPACFRCRRRWRRRQRWRWSV
ncbi:MAG: Two-component system sensor histidine kinase, partial [uncultured Acidimicrobiales bacterium]